MANKYESALFSYKTLRLIMILVGSLLIALGGSFVAFMISNFPMAEIMESPRDTLFALLAIPAGLYICITGKKLKKPILED
jgi:hypothetical protein